MVNQLGYIIPTTAAIGNHNEIIALNTAKDTAIQAEQAIYSIIQTASMVGGRSQGGAQALLLTTGHVPVNDGSSDQQPSAWTTSSQRLQYHACSASSWGPTFWEFPMG